MEVVRARIRARDFSWLADNMVDLVAPVNLSADPIATLESPDSATATLYDDRKDAYIQLLRRPIAVAAEAGDTVLSFERIDGWAAGDAVEVLLDDRVHETTLASVDGTANTVTLDDALPIAARVGQPLSMRDYVAGKTRLHVSRTPWNPGDTIEVRLADDTFELNTIDEVGEERGQPYVVLDAGLTGDAVAGDRVAKPLGSPVNLSGYNLANAATGTCDWGYRGVFPAGSHSLEPGHRVRIELAFSEGAIDYSSSARVMVRG